MALRGNMYGIRVGGISGEFIPCEIDCELSIESEMVNKSGSASGSYRKYRYGYTTWRISCNARMVLGILRSNTNSLVTAQLNRLEIEVYISARQSSTETLDLGGTVLIPAQTLSFGNTGFANHSITFQGSGALYNSATMSPFIINNNPIEADYPKVYNQNLW